MSCCSKRPKEELDAEESVQVDSEGEEIKAQSEMRAH
jgi:hypothetical protein